MLAAVSSNEVWQKIVDFFTITVKDFFVELLAENPPIKFILLVAGAALVLPRLLHPGTPALFGGQVHSHIDQGVQQYPVQLTQ